MVLMDGDESRAVRLLCKFSDSERTKLTISNIKEHFNMKGQIKGSLVRAYALASAGQQVRRLQTRDLDPKLATALQSLV